MKKIAGLFVFGLILVFLTACGTTEETIEVRTFQDEDHPLIAELDGYLYEGEVRNGKPNGFGTLTDEDGIIIYEGDWENGDFHGNGKFYERLLLCDCSFENGSLVDKSEIVIYGPTARGYSAEDVTGELAVNGLAFYKYFEGSLSEEEMVVKGKLWLEENASYDETNNKVSTFLHAEGGATLTEDEVKDDRTIGHNAVLAFLRSIQRMELENLSEGTKIYFPNRDGEEGFEVREVVNGEFVSQ